jgi:hypothetical protein
MGSGSEIEREDVDEVGLDVKGNVVRVDGIASAVLGKPDRGRRDGI